MLQFNVQNICYLWFFVSLATTARIAIQATANSISRAPGLFSGYGVVRAFHPDIVSLIIIDET